MQTVSVGYMMRVRILKCCALLGRLQWSSEELRHWRRLNFANIVEALFRWR